MTRQANNAVFSGLAAILFIVGIPSCFGIPGCWGHRCLDLCSDFECIERPEDATGYLRPICEYISEHFDCYPQDPNKLEIVQVVSGAEQDSYGLPQYSTAEYDFVELSCCHLGDWAIVHVESKTVVDFMVGDY